MFTRSFILQTKLRDDYDNDSKQKALHSDPSAIQQITFTAKLDRAGNTTMFFIIEEAKETVSVFSQGTVKLLSLCCIIIEFI